jgi:hypothetical protein
MKFKPLVLFSHAQSKLGSTLAGFASWHLNRSTVTSVWEFQYSLVKIPILEIANIPGRNIPIFQEVTF